MTPTAIGPVSLVAVGYQHACARLVTGAVECWGSNSNGQLGNGTYSDSGYPVFAAGVTNATSVTVGQAHSCSLLAPGGILCWGSGGAGVLGNGNFLSSSNVPVPVTGLAGGAVEVVAGDQHTCARLATGAVQCWGANRYDQLGNGTTTASFSPVYAMGVTDAV